MRRVRTSLWLSSINDTGMWLDKDNGASRRNKIVPCLSPAAHELFKPATSLRMVEHDDSGRGWLDKDA